MWGIDEGPQGPDLYRHLVDELDKLKLAYLHIVDTGDQRLLADIRTLWRQPLVLNRPGKPREKIGDDVDSGFADLET